MKQLVVLSGKGGTGKTTVTAALAHLASSEMSAVLVDADVDAANLELVLDPTKQGEHKFMGGHLAVVDPQKCTACGVCADVCRFEAVVVPPTASASLPRTEGEMAYTIDPLACEGCAACFYQCPEQAIRMVEQQAGLWFRSDTRFGPLFHAHLLAGQENSGKLVTLVKQQARLQGRDMEAALLLVDGPPGIGCPVISASSGMDLALHVVEPTVSGVHDLERILATTDHFGVPSVVAINKADLNPGRAGEIVTFCADQGVEVVGRISYDTVVTEAMVNGLPVTEYTDAPVAQAMHEVWEGVKRRLFAG
jgi:MinD superfamily P-loop ATPase